MSKTYVLDACALVAVLKNESGADKVVAAYKNVESDKGSILINRVNLCEVYYGFYRKDGKTYADSIINAVERSFISIREFDKALFYEAGRLKATYKISFADSVALAQAIVTGGELLTSDHHEFDAIEGREKIHLLWIR